MSQHIASASEVPAKKFRVFWATQIVLKRHKNEGCKKPLEEVAQEVVTELAARRPHSKPYDLDMVNESLTYLIQRGVLEAYREDENVFLRVLDNHLIRVTHANTDSSLELHRRWCNPERQASATA